MILQETRYHISEFTANESNKAIFGAYIVVMDETESGISKN